MTSTGEPSPRGSVISEIFAFSGVECRLTVSQSPAGYAATTYCPFCGKAIGSGPANADQNSAVSQTKAKFHDHFGHCPMRNTERPPLGVKSS